MDYIGSLTSEEFIMLYQSINIISNQELLYSLKASEYGQLTTKSRKQIHKKIMRAAYPDSGEIRPLTTAEMAHLMGAIK